MLRYFGNPTSIMLPGVCLLSRCVQRRVPQCRAVLLWWLYLQAVPGSHLAQVQGWLQEGSASASALSAAVCGAQHHPNQHFQTCFLTLLQLCQPHVWLTVSQLYFRNFIGFLIMAVFPKFCLKSFLAASCPVHCGYREQFIPFYEWTCELLPVVPSLHWTDPDLL